MKFSLIVCTYNRPLPLLKLLNSVAEQSYYPDQILIIDGSEEMATQELIEKSNFQRLEYFKVSEDDRGLTRQRNLGIEKLDVSSNIICFLDDDIILSPDYFKELMGTYDRYQDAIGVGGYILDEVEWKISEFHIPLGFHEYTLDGWKRKLGSRNLLRKRLALLSDQPPGVMPSFSNGLSISFLPPSGKTYPVEYFMGGVASYRKELFNKIAFSEFFEGYGLYEDLDFCLRASEVGHLYVNTRARVHHYHEKGGRPNSFKYGKMVLRNGWYVWRVRFKNPSFSARWKWHATAMLLTFIRLCNVLNTTKKREALTESLGRIFGWWSIIWNKPKP
ncbi:glycosyltransferase family 2 protein [Salinimicrobium sp. TH3]|uniref:glycosyltransferase family 2 protein n=1 Tax=Salinimicrobium sp. TH3 TaxID=2997342 RepID=UPI0022753DB0|nr:glycosyltransferase family 2 protein [Salinimicrobium sp. TH3]MCY2687871.1 glycosyltransferase family 2 protein [Salinimicrobium sp. TH3]